MRKLLTLLASLLLCTGAFAQQGGQFSGGGGGGISKPGGSDTDVQYNCANALCGAALLNWDNINTILTIGNPATDYFTVTAATQSANRTLTFPDANFTAGPLVTDASGNITYPGALTVANGGTGLATLTAHAIYAGEGTSVPAAIGPDAVTTHFLASGGSSADPAFRALAAGDMPAYTGGDCTSSAGSVALTCTQVNGSNLTVNSSGVPTKVAGVTTAGEGVAIVQCATNAKTETGADASVLSCTPASAAGSYEACVSLDVSAASAATLGWTMTWTNSKGNANAPTNMSLFQMGVAAPALTFSAAANNSYYACVPIAVNNAGTAIVVKTTFSGTSIAYNASAIVKRVF